MVSLFGRGFDSLQLHEVLPHITDYQLVGDIFVYIKLHEFACKGKIVGKTEPNNDLFVLLIELDEDENGNIPMQE